jgi:putative hemolysin
MTPDFTPPPDDPGAAGTELPGFLLDVPDIELVEGRYRVRFARSAEDLAAAQALRFRVFNLELGEGLEESHLTGRDEDPFDTGCHHLLVIDDTVDEIIGTYRMQTHAMATRHMGYYSAGEFDLSAFGDDMLARAVEVGRACVALEHRKQRVLFALWRGLAAYMLTKGTRYLFGCCSLTSQDQAEGLATMARLREMDVVAPGPLLQPLPGLGCEGPAPTPEQIAAVKIPKLFGTYLRFRSLVHSEPAVDREFKTIDWIVVMDIEALDAKTVQLFFGASAR